MSASDFQLWLDQRVWVEDNKKLRRREYIPLFAEELTAYVRSLGFTMSYEWRKGHMCVARWMYILMRNKDPVYPAPFHRNWSEDLYEFHHIFTHEATANFFEGWKLYADFDQETHVGQRYLHELQHLVYPYIDMDASKAGMRVAIALEDLESDADSWKSGYRRTDRRDVYLEEAQDGYHGGKGFKV